jgi:ATP-dependent Clp protease, protease subunit
LTQDDSARIGEFKRSAQSIVCVGDITQEESRRIISELLLIDSLYDSPIRVIINSNGGTLYDTFAIYDVIKSLANDVYTTGIGSVMSAATIILASGKKGWRSVGAHSRLLLHELCLSGEFGGKVFETEQVLYESKELQRMMIETLSKETSMSKDAVEEIMETHKDKYFGADEAVRLGLCDLIIGSAAHSEEVKGMSNVKRVVGF